MLYSLKLVSLPLNDCWMLVQNVEKKEASALQFDAGSFCAASIVAVVEMSEYNIGFYVWELIHLKKYTQRQKKYKITGNTTNELHITNSYLVTVELFGSLVH